VEVRKISNFLENASPSLMLLGLKSLLNPGAPGLESFLLFQLRGDGRIGPGVPSSLVLGS